MGIILKKPAIDPAAEEKLKPIEVADDMLCCYGIDGESGELLCRWDTESNGGFWAIAIRFPAENANNAEKFIQAETPKMRDRFVSRLQEIENRQKGSNE